MQELIVVMTTFPTVEDASRVAKALVEAKLAACCNVIPGVRSVYIWEGKLEDQSEALLWIKTRKGLFHALEGEIKRLHGYSLPEIISLPITAGSEAYLHWLERSTL